MTDGKFKTRTLLRSCRKGINVPYDVVEAIESCCAFAGGRKSRNTKTRGNRVADNYVLRARGYGIFIRIRYGSQCQNNVEATSASDAFRAELFVCSNYTHIFFPFCCSKYSI